MTPDPEVLLTIGAVLLVGIVADVVGTRTGLPRVTLLLLLGFAVGPEVLDLPSARLPGLVPDDLDHRPDDGRIPARGPGPNRPAA